MNPQLFFNIAASVLGVAAVMHLLWARRWGTRRHGAWLSIVHGIASTAGFLAGLGFALMAQKVYVLSWLKITEPAIWATLVMVLFGSLASLMRLVRENRRERDEANLTREIKKDTIRMRVESLLPDKAHHGLQ